MDILSKGIMDSIRSRYATPTADSIAAASTKRKGVMAKTQERISSALDDATQDALAAVVGLSASTKSARTEVDLEEEARKSSEEAALLRMESEYTGAFDNEEGINGKPKRKTSDGIMAMPADGVQPSDGKASKFESTSKKLVADLKKDFGLTTMQASAIVGNLATETDNFNALQEYKPVVEGSRGGYGFAQWTGARRERYEAWAKDNNLDPATYEANYGYLKYELSNTDPEIGNMGKNTIKKLKKAQSLKEATTIVMDGYLKPGTPHLDKRQKSAAAILGFFD